MARKAMKYYQKHKDQGVTLKDAWDAVRGNRFGLSDDLVFGTDTSDEQDNEFGTGTEEYETFQALQEELEEEAAAKEKAKAAEAEMNAWIKKYPQKVNELANTKHSLFNPVIGITKYTDENKNSLKNPAHNPGNEEFDFGFGCGDSLNSRPNLTM
jgi:hypothetical protein